MCTIDTMIEIDAPPGRVWYIFADTAAWPDWNPFIRRLEGAFEPGAVLEVTIQPPGRGAMRLKPRVIEAEPGRRLRWLGRLGVRGIFDGEHSFSIEPLPEGRTRFRHSEVFRGLLVPLVGGILVDTKRGFEAMNAALKARAEAR
jgi:hypothetical protein